MKTPPIVSAEEWKAAWEQMLVKEKEMTRARDALAAERRRMPWVEVEKDYVFDGPDGKVSLLDLFAGRRQLILYRAFFEPGVFGWPDHACRGCSLGADQVSNLTHLNARDTTLVYASRAPQPDIERLKARMGWEQIPWYTMTDDFDKDFGVDEWHGTRHGRSPLVALLEGGPPVEESLLPLMSGLGTALLLVRAWAFSPLRRKEAQGHRAGRRRPLRWPGRA